MKNKMDSQKPLTEISERHLERAADNFVKAWLHGHPNADAIKARFKLTVRELVNFEMEKILHDAEQSGETPT
jgi:hypothetical protein